jgi:hypothetical protein
MVGESHALNITNQNLGSPTAVSGGVLLFLSDIVRLAHHRGFAHHEQVWVVLARLLLFEDEAMHLRAILACSLATALCIALSSAEYPAEMLS